MEKTSKNEKKREFAFILYPESANDNWKEILSMLQQKVFYVLHDKDIDFDGNLKKPHYHVMIMYDTPRSSSTVSKIAVKCGSNGFLEHVMSKRGYARYLCHLDNPEKYQYSSNDVVCLGGVDYNSEIKSKTELKHDKLASIAEIMKFCSDNEVHFYADLLEYCVVKRLDWLEILTTYSGQVIKDYIKSHAYACIQGDSRLKRFKDFDK